MLGKNRDILPEKLASFLPRMTREDWLGSYRNLDRVSAVLDRISKRLENKFKREVTLYGASEEIEANYPELERNFEEFFPDVIEYVDNYRNNSFSPGSGLIPADTASSQ